MRLTRLSVISTAAALLVGITIAGGAAAQGPATTSTGGSPSIKVVDDPPTAPVSVSQPTKPTVVTLLTGDRVRVDGKNVTPLGTGRSLLMRFGWGGDVYAVPAAALPYLGSTLDMRLFDVSYLVRSGGAVPVTVSTTGTAAPLAAGTTTLDAAKAREIGAHIKARNLTGIKQIALAPQADAAAQPAGPPTAPASGAAPAAAAGKGGGLPYDTLTINTLDRSGAAGEALIMVQNLNDPSLALFLAQSDGSASFSLPEGDYSVVANVLTADGDGFDGALVADPQFALHGDKTITLDSRAARPYQATLDPQIAAPAVREDIITFTRTGAGGDAETGGGFNMSLLSFSPNPLPQYLAYTLYAAPTSPVHTGAFDFDAYTFLDDCALCGTSQAGPAYALSFPHRGGIPGNLTHQIHQADLTAVDDDLYDGPDGGGVWYLAFSAYQPWGDYQGLQIQVTAGDRTDYWYSSAPDTERWQIEATPPNQANRFSAFHSARHGGRVREVWNKGPMVPSPASTRINLLTAPVSVAPPDFGLCPACRQDDNGTLFLSTYGDSDPSHSSSGWYRLSSSTIRFSRDGTLAMSSADSPNGTMVADSVLLPMLHQRASYELDWSMARATDRAAVTDTDWRFTSAPGTRTRLPATEQCAPDASRACAALPLLFVNYDLALDHQSRAPARSPFTVAFTLGYQQGAPAARGLGATVSVSYDDGQTWSTPKAAHADGNGRFSLAVQHPDGDGFVSLRVEAHDGAGNTVRQTVIRAYRLVQR